MIRDCTDCTAQCTAYHGIGLLALYENEWRKIGAKFITQILSRKWD